MIFKNVGRAFSALIVVLTLILSVSVYADTLTIDVKLERIDLNGVVTITLEETLLDSCDYTMIKTNEEQK